WPVIKSHKPPSKGIQLRRTDSVELDTAAHLEKDGDCFYVENTLFSSVLGLAIWPAIFTPIKGAFSHPFQHRPHDFYQPSFHQQRAELIQAELSLQIDDQKAFLERLLKRLELKRGVANPLVYWNAIDEQLLQKSLDRIAVAHWQVIFQRLLSDLRNHRNGLPDLIHFPSTGGYELVEVKGPGDRLQDNQKRWMAFFERHQIPHWVAQVSWIDND
ncbi:MAG: VRR-NUC domain-containing protein, partial [Granulosicoccaceae bacterium]